MAVTIPTLLFGAFDRHNFGDLLFPHVATALLPGRSLIYAGLAARDLRPWGGHQTRALAQLASDSELRDRPVNILHVGGELLTCDAWQAAVMLLAPDQVPATLARYAAQPAAQQAWTREFLGIAAEVPYSIARDLFPQAAQILYCAVGGVELAERDARLRAEAVANLRDADGVSVRDRVTQQHLAAAGVQAALLPDPAVTVAELFARDIHYHAHHGEVARVRAAFPQGYMAVQLSADFGDDATLRAIAAQLDRAAGQTGLAVVLFRAGAAPWHDDLACYRRLAAHLHAPALWLFSSLHVWDICALIGHSRAYCGSSLHGRIIAMACGLPRVNVRPPDHAGQVMKQDAYSAAWEMPAMPAVVAVEDVAQGLAQATAVAAEQLQHHAGELAVRYRRGFSALVAAMG